MTPVAPALASGVREVSLPGTVAGADAWAGATALTVGAARRLVEGARWYGDRPAPVAGLAPLGWLTPSVDGIPTSWPALRPVLVTLEAPGAGPQTWQLVLAHRDATTDAVELADAPWALPALATAVAEVLGEPDVAVDDVGLVPGEQSNTTALLGPWAVKVRRLVEPGPRVEVERLCALAAVADVPSLLASVTADLGGDVDLLLVIERVVDGGDGYQHAVVSASRRGEVDWAHALGATVARVHAALAPSVPAQRPARELAATLAGRIQAAVADVPALRPHAAGLVGVVDRLGSQPVAVQPVHGDLHLGQTLLSCRGWHVIDLGGEPFRTPEELARPDTVWRDVAGLLRSLDYARASADDPDSPAAFDWQDRARAALLAGWLGDRPLTPREAALLAAHEADRVAHEARYEARHRPDWLGIPLAAAARLVKENR